MKTILQKSAAMPDLRIIVLGCLALASVVAGRGEIITGCLFSPFCKVGDGKSGWKLGELAKELKDLRDQVFFNEQLPDLIRCVGIIDMTKVETKMNGCYDETMVQRPTRYTDKDCTIPCKWLFPDAKWITKE